MRMIFNYTGAALAVKTPPFDRGEPLRAKCEAGIFYPADECFFTHVTLGMDTELKV